MNDNNDWLDTFSLVIICVVGGFVAGVLANHYEYNTSTPIKKDVIIDSLTTVNDSLKLKVERLDSIKNAKVIEVSTLNNDSTLKLFYKLVSE